MLGFLRNKIAEDKNLIQDSWKFVWVTDFPMFEHDIETKKWKCLHHPFTMPKSSLDELVNSPELLSSKSYDLVLNGTELGGGSIRINDIGLPKLYF